MGILGQAWSQEERVAIWTGVSASHGSITSPATGVRCRYCGNIPEMAVRYSPGPISFGKHLPIWRDVQKNRKRA